MNLRDKDDTKEELYGETHGRDFKIDISTSYSRDIQEATLFHEAMHAALSVSGLTHVLNEKTEEAIVSCFESAFGHIVDVYQLGIDNDDKPVV